MLREAVNPKTIMIQISGEQYLLNIIVAGNLLKNMTL